MYFCFMIVVTGAAGFIGSCLVAKLNQLGITDILLVDDFSNREKNKNLVNAKYFSKIERSKYIHWFSKNSDSVTFVYHIGARTDTTEFNSDIFNQLNLTYSKKLWEICALKDIPFVYASSAATYGLGELGFDDDHSIISSLKPLNPYAVSKNNFDKWILSQENSPRFWMGLKFFNVYGPNEFHKDRMASVILHTFKQIQLTGRMKLFKSHNKSCKDGEQLRDFIYVKDIVMFLVYLLDNQNKRGIYNLGTGRARTFNDLARLTFKALKMKSNIEFIDMPKDIRKNYQYFTQANIQKIRIFGYKNPFTTLEEGVFDYVENYLTENKYF